jgi:large subunit ribosomal protein L22
MEVRSIHNGARISAFKCREVTREIQGLSASKAVDILTFTPKKSARLVLSTLKSAIANAENNNNLRADKLVVKEAVVGEGPTLKRMATRARGSGGAIRKRTSNIKITLTDEVDTSAAEPKPKAKAKRQPKAGKKSNS